jgi:aspartate ammonia-lyase
MHLPAHLFIQLSSRRRWNGLIFAPEQLVGQVDSITPEPIIPVLSKMSEAICFSFLGYDDAVSTVRSVLLASLDL